ncbi:Uncharacterised protein [Salmonella enterica subsp. enterica serovar Typhimurium str. DT104]|nr:Uncharacterised protein [Salmonella enterica subsp. enterica serovar Typhimurium str. DT104]
MEVIDEDLGAKFLMELMKDELKKILLLRKNMQNILYLNQMESKLPN